MTCLLGFGSVLEVICSQHNPRLQGAGHFLGNLSAIMSKSLVCYWAVIELGMSLSKLAGIFKMSVPGIGYAVERGEKLARIDGFKLVV